MTILETLQTDHRQVKVLLETILSTYDAKKRGDLFKQFRTELTAHSRAEEMGASAQINGPLVARCSRSF